MIPQCKYQQTLASTMVSKWCRISSIHGIIKRILFSSCQKRVWHEVFSKFASQGWFYTNRAEGVHTEMGGPVFCGGPFLESQREIKRNMALVRARPGSMSMFQKSSLWHRIQMSFLASNVCSNIVSYHGINTLIRVKGISAQRAFKTSPKVHFLRFLLVLREHQYSHIVMAVAVITVTYFSARGCPNAFPFGLSAGSDVSGE